MITQLQSNEIFVFGSNLNGANGGGAARQAEESFGAMPGIGVGRASHNTYALPTLDGNYQKLPLNVIKRYLEQLAHYAELHPDYKFLLTKIGTGIAGFTEEEMESIMPPFPSNVIRV